MMGDAAMARWRSLFVALLLTMALSATSGGGLGVAGPTPAFAQEKGHVPGGALGGTSDSEIWRAIRSGEKFTSSLPNPQAGVLIQSEGETWRAFRNGPLSTYGAWALLGIVALLGLFFAIRGRIRIESGRSGHPIERFGFLDRFAHWLTASSFLVLALSGLNMLYGRYLLRPLIGPQAFSWLTIGGKYAHNFLAFGFMIGLALMIVLWIWQNFPNRYDFIWLAKAGGLLSRHGHAPSKKFNAGQKILFWLVVLAGISVSTWVNWLFGTDYPTQLAPLQEMQLAQVWHAIVGLFLTVVIIGHIYIGTVGMEGAFEAMGTGEVDENWAREHHDKWVEDLERKGALAAGDD
jgi:formate dehydrogenase subunit gamma